MLDTAILERQTNTGGYKKLFSSSSATGWVNRFALFIIYVWFGICKCMHQLPIHQFGDSHRTGLAHSLISPENMQAVMGSSELFIGLLFLIPRLTKIAFILFLLHIATTFLPFFYLPGNTWTSRYILTMSGQFIVKNLVLVVCAFTILLDHIQTGKSISLQV